MLTVHHLNNSRSQRVLWLLEELGLPYEIKHYKRDRKTMLAPPELRQVHPLGKSPVVTDGDITLAESGAVIEYFVQTYGREALVPRDAENQRSPEFVGCAKWPCGELDEPHFVAERGVHQEPATGDEQGGHGEV